MALRPRGTGPSPLVGRPPQGPSRREPPVGGLYWPKPVGLGAVAPSPRWPPQGAITAMPPSGPGGRRPIATMAPAGGHHGDAPRRGPLLAAASRPGGRRPIAMMAPGGAITAIPRRGIALPCGRLGRRPSPVAPPRGHTAIPRRGCGMTHTPASGQWGPHVPPSGSSTGTKPVGAAVAAHDITRISTSVEELTRGYGEPNRVYRGI